MGDDNALERTALLSVHLFVSTPQQDINVCGVLRSLLQACQPALVLQVLKQALDAHKAGHGHLHELEQGMRSDEQTQLGNWATNADQLPLCSDDGDIEWLWTCSDGPPSHNCVCVKVRLKAALVLLHNPAKDVQIMSARRCLWVAASKGLLVVTDALLNLVPELLDYRIDGVPELGSCDCKPLLIACESTTVSDDVRVKMVKLLLHRFRSRAGQPVPFYSIGRDLQVAPEFQALQAARLDRATNGHAAVELLLLDAGVPPQLDPHMLALMNGAAPRGGLTPEAIVQAMRFFGGNSPMAFGYLVGSLGLEDRPPPEGWESCDPGGVKAKAMQERDVVKAQMNEYRSRLLFAESERLRDDLLRDQAELRQRDGAPVLLAFVCNPDRTLGQRLPQALNDALAASHTVAARIFGGTYSAPGTVGEAAAEDRRCTFERLEAELSRQRFRIFLFSGHADMQDQERPKTLGFTGSDGKFAPVVDARKVAELLGCVCLTHQAPSHQLTDVRVCSRVAAAAPRATASIWWCSTVARASSWARCAARQAFRWWCAGRPR